MPQAAGQSVTQLLARWKAGDQHALEALVPLVYNELRALAHRQLRRERPGHTLQTTALVNEAYVRLVSGRPFEVDSRAHFVAVAARLMRQILVDYARSHRAAKRGSDRVIELGALDPGQAECPASTIPGPDLVLLDDALNDLARIDEQQSRIVELRFFGGLTVDETADVLGISRSTAKRDWNVAKAWLSRQLKRGAHGEERKLAQN
jgi:RNA polymerase sigma factor (TIGR02999 family)